MATITGLSNDALNTNFSTVSGSINFTGLGSGTDFNSVIDQLVQLESINKTRMETWRSTWQAKLTSIQSLNDRLSALEEAAGAMDTDNEFMVRQATTSDSSVVTATATSNANTGAYNVTVGSSVPNILRSAGFADSGATAVGGAGGNLTFTVNGTSYSAAILAGDTLSDVAGAINGIVGQPVVATIEDDGTASNPYHLVLTSQTGGDAGRILITQNPTDVGLSDGDIALQGDSWTGTSAYNFVGQFTGDKATDNVYEYNFQIQEGVGPATVGTDAFDLLWQVNGGGWNTINVPATYTPGESIAIENGINIQLDAGTVSNGDTFDLRGYAQDIDDAEEVSWTGPAITTSGNYMGTVSKTYDFKVSSGGALDTGTARTLAWTDSLGNTGTVSVTDSNTAYEVEQGVYISFAAGTDLTNNDTFLINVFAPQFQRGQDTGLAQVAKAIHAGYNDTDTTPVTTADGTFSYTYGGQTVDVAVTADTTLGQLVSLINDDADNPGVTASILNDGQGLPTSYKLVLTGQDTGSQYQITNVSHDFTEPAGYTFSNGGDLGGGFDLTQSATNSMLKVDGYPSDADLYIQRSTNEVSDVVDGVILDLHDAGDAKITVSTDTDAVYSQIEAFINAVNYAQDFIRYETRFDASTEEKGTLIGNYAYYTLKSDIDSTLNSSVSGLVDGSDTYTNLAQIGIHTDPDNEGTWVIDSATLRSAINSNSEAVANLFIDNGTKGTEGVAKQMYDKMVAQTDPDTGILNVLVENYNGIIKNIDNRIDYEDQRLELYRKRLTDRFARLEAALTELNSTSSAIDAAVKQLPGTKSG